MEIEINFKKSLQENASDYFEKSKKAKRKVEGIEKAALEVEKKIKNAKEKKEDSEKKEPTQKKTSLEWYEKFHWFFSSDNFLIIGGRDAKNNELAVKKYMQPEDIYFHAEIHGAPHCIVKTNGKEVPGGILKEVAEFAATFSSAWKQGISSVDVYSVKPEQVSKKAPSGESLGAGAFMIYGQRDWYKKTPLSFALGIMEKNNSKVLISGPVSAVKAHAEIFMELKQGSLKKGDAAKKAKEFFEKKLGKKLPISIDEFLQMMPAGNFAFKEK